LILSAIINLRSAFETPVVANDELRAPRFSAQNEGRSYFRPGTPNSDVSRQFTEQKINSLIFKTDSPHLLNQIRQPTMAALQLIEFLPTSCKITTVIQTVASIQAKYYSGQAMFMKSHTKPGKQFARYFPSQKNDHCSQNSLTPGRYAKHCLIWEKSDLDLNYGSKPYRKDLRTGV
jgi:hypothetical protein